MSSEMKTATIPSFQLDVARGPRRGHRARGLREAQVRGAAGAVKLPAWSARLPSDPATPAATTVGCPLNTGLELDACCPSVQTARFAAPTARSGAARSQPSRVDRKKPATVACFHKEAQASGPEPRGGAAVAC